MAISAGTVVADAKMNMRGFMRDLSIMKKGGSKAADRIENKYKKLGGRMQSIGQSMTMSLTAPLAAMGAASVKAFSTFDSEMTKSTAIMNNVSKQMRGTMEQAAMSVSEDLNMASSKAAESFFFLASAGLDAEQSVAALPQVAEFAKAGMFDMATATDLATDAQSALGLTVDDAAQNMKNMKRVTDVLVNANTDANASVQQFATALTNRGASSLRNYNKSLEEGIGVLAAFADQGIKGRRAGMMLSRMLRITSRAAGENTKQFKELGIVTPEGELASMANIVKGLTNALDGLKGPQKTAKLEAMGFTAEVQQALLPLLGMSDALKEYTESAKDAGGATAEVADKQMKGFGEQLGVTWQMIRNAGIEIGDMLAPAIGELNTLVRAAVSTWRGFSDTTKGIIMSIGSLVAAIGPLIAATGTLIKFIPALTAGFKALQGTLMANPLYAIGTALAFVGAKAIIAHQEVNQLKSSIDALLKSDAASMDRINKKITEMGEKYKAAAEAAATIPGMEAEDLIDPELESRLNKLIKLRDKLAAGNFIEQKTKQQLEDTNFLTQFLNTNFEQLASTASQADLSRPLVEAKRIADQLIPAFEDVGQKLSDITHQSLMADFKPEGLDLGSKIAPEGSMAAAKERVRGLRQELMFATDPERIAVLRGQINKLTKDSEKSRNVWQGFSQTIGKALQQAVVHGKELGSILSNLAKQLASKAIMTGLKFLLPGGPAIGGAGFFGEMFGGMFHSGGMVPGSGDRMIRAKGGEMVLTQSQQRALGGMMGGGGTSINPRAIGKEISNQLEQKMSKLGPNEVWVMSQKGRRAF